MSNYIIMMELEELKKELIGRTLPEEVSLGKHAKVTDIKKFLHIQFLSCENWTKELEKCPSYIRLTTFYEVVKSL